MDLRRLADDTLEITVVGSFSRLGYQARDNVGSFAGIASALDPSGLFSSDRITGDIGFMQEQFRPDWDLQATLSVLHLTQEADRDSRLFPPGANPGTGSDTGSGRYPTFPARAQGPSQDQRGTRKGVQRTAAKISAAACRGGNSESHRTFPRPPIDGAETTLESGQTVPT